MTSGVGYELKIQKILDIYSRLYMATRRYIKHEKITYFYWQWQYFGLRKKIVNKELKLKINGEQVKALDWNQSIRILGIFIAPSMKWMKQYKVMKDKMQYTIAKLQNTVIVLPLTYIFFNQYLIKSIYFGYRVVYLNKVQEKELMKIYEEPILKKIGLSAKFPR